MPSKKQANTKSDLHFEDAIERLEEIIENAEDEEVINQAKNLLKSF